MCGIAGFILTDPQRTTAAMTRLATAMGDTLVHRGPDAGDTWVDAARGVGFSHRRLSIVELSPAGAQPMTSACQTGVLCYNGEIYNRDALRALAHTTGNATTAPFAGAWRGHSDTEALLEVCTRSGPSAAAAASIGMFAYAYLHQTTQQLTLVRDRLGIKPLFYWQGPEGFAFASQPRALLALPFVSARANLNALHVFLRHAYTPAPHTAFDGIHQLEPGQTLTINVADPAALPTITPFWRADDVVKNARAEPFNGTDAEAVDALDELIQTAVGDRLMADVPLGAFLSGGIDSSAVVAAMQTVSPAKARTFSIGFDVTGYNEADHAQVSGNGPGM
ncbi:MAG: asparagine synthetase B, partial [Pseudomonadota bacterium]